LTALHLVNPELAEAPEKLSHPLRAALCAI
jgi:hypothetical protein